MMTSLNVLSNKPILYQVLSNSAFASSVSLKCAILLLIIFSSPFLAILC